MSNMHTESYNAFKQVGATDELAQKAAIAIAGDQHLVLDKLTTMQQELMTMQYQLNNTIVNMERDIDKKLTEAREDIDKKFGEVREDIHKLDKKFLVITTVMSTALPIIGGLLFFVLKNIS